MYAYFEHSISGQECQISPANATNNSAQIQHLRGQGHACVCTEDIFFPNKDIYLSLMIYASLFIAILTN